MKLACRCILGRCSYFYEEVLIRELVPGMGDMCVAEAHTERINALRVKGRQVECIEDFGIDRLCALVAKHSADFLFSAMVVSGTVALVCAGEDVAVDIYRSALAVCPRYIDDHDTTTLIFHRVHILVCKDIIADFLTVVD